MSYTYGYNEYSCNGRCSFGSYTASGEKFRKDIPSAAIPLPRKMRLHPFWIGLKTENGPCIKIRINDKAAPKLIGKRGFDISPYALKLLIGHSSSTWSGRLELCDKYNNDPDDYIDVD